VSNPLLDALGRAERGREPSRQRRRRPEPSGRGEVSPLSQAVMKAEKRRQGFRRTGRLDLITGLDFFSGVGGFSIGAMQAGCRLVGVQRQAAPSRVAAMHGHAVVRGDARQVAIWDDVVGVNGLDLMIGGPPCQPFSSEGMRRGEYDPRDGFPILLRAVDTYRPRRVVFENVSGFMQKRYRAYRKRLLGDLRRYFSHVGVWVLNARDYGVPQCRVRVFVWGAERHLEPPAKTHGPGTGRSWVSVRDALPRLGAEAVITRNTSAVSRSVDECAPTFTSSGILYTAPRPGLVYGTDPEARRGRRVTIEEALVIQGFPTDYHTTGTSPEQYRMIGNAVPPPLGRAVMEAVTADLRAQRLTPEQAVAALVEVNPEARLFEPRKPMPRSKKFEGLDKAIVGVTNASPKAGGKLVAIYSWELLLDGWLDLYADDMPELDNEQRGEELFSYAVQALDANVSGADTEPYGPVVLHFGTLEDLGMYDLGAVIATAAEREE